MKSINILCLFLCCACNSNNSGKRKLVDGDNLYNKAAKYFCDCYTADTNKIFEIKNTRCVELMERKFYFEFAKLGVDTSEDASDEALDIEVHIYGEIMDRVKKQCPSYEDVNAKSLENFMEKQGYDLYFQGIIIDQEKINENQYNILMEDINSGKRKAFSYSKLLDKSYWKNSSSIKSFFIQYNRSLQNGKEINEIIQVMPIYD